MKDFLNLYLTKIFGFIVMALATCHGFGLFTVPGPQVIDKPAETAAAFIVGVILFLFSKDEIKGYIRRLLNKKLDDGAKMLLLLVIASASLSSCTKNGLPIISEKHTHDSTTIIREKLVPVPIPGSNVQLTQKQIDSLALMLAKYQPGAKIVYIKDPSGATQLKIWRDSITGELRQQCETLARNAEVKVTETEKYYRTEIEKIKFQAEEEKKKWYQVLGDQIESMFWKLVFVLFLFFLLREAIKFLIIHKGESGNKIKSFLGFK
jgi:hypothetical protein